MGLLTMRSPSLAMPSMKAPALVFPGSEERLLIQDSYNRLDTDSRLGVADTGQTWVYVGNAPGGRFNISENRARVNSATGDHAYISVWHANVKIEQRITSFISGLWPVAFRVVDANNFFVVKANASTYTLVKKVASSNTTLGTYTATPANDDVIMVTVKDDLITVYVNGIPVITATDPALNTCCNVGWAHLNCLGATVDDFKCWLI